MSEENSGSDESDSSNEEEHKDLAIPKIFVSGMTSEQNGFTEQSENDKSDALKKDAVVPEV